MPPKLTSSSSWTASLRARTQRRRETLSGLHGADRASRAARNDLLPGLELVERRVVDLSRPARNVRGCDPAHVREVAASIATLGFCVPILIDPGGRVLDGWVRVLAAGQVGLDRVPCVLAGHLTSAEKRLLRIALNRLGETGSWDLDELRLEFQDLIIDDAPIEIAGFSGPDLDMILSDEEPDGLEEGPLEPEEGVGLNPQARPGDIFVLGAHRVACGDARDPELIARLMDGNKARLVLTDVPYNVPIKGHVTGQKHREFAMASGEMSTDEFAAFNQAWMAAATPHLVDGGILGTFIDWRGLPAVQAAADALELASLNLIVWSKTNAGMGSLYRSAHELLPIFKKGKASHVNNIQLGRHGRWRSNVWTYPGASSIGSDARQGLRSHPTVKPTVMLEDALLDLTGRGEVVLDPFLGSGSTLIAAEKAGRACRGVEIDPAYVDLILRRYEAVTGQRGRLVPSTTFAS